MWERLKGKMNQVHVPGGRGKQEWEGARTPPILRCMHGPNGADKMVRPRCRQGTPNMANVCLGAQQQSLCRAPAFGIASTSRASPAKAAALCREHPHPCRNRVLAVNRTNPAPCTRQRPCPCSRCGPAVWKAGPCAAQQSPLLLLMLWACGMESKATCSTASAPAHAHAVLLHCREQNQVQHSRRPCSCSCCAPALQGAKLGAAGTKEAGPIGTSDSAGKVEPAEGRASGSTVQDSSLGTKHATTAAAAGTKSSQGEGASANPSVAGNGGGGGGGAAAPVGGSRPGGAAAADDSLDAFMSSMAVQLDDEKVRLRKRVHAFMHACTRGCA